jgi:hypothetical protein
MASRPKGQRAKDDKRLLASTKQSWLESDEKFGALPNPLMIEFVRDTFVIGLASRIRDPPWNSRSRNINATSLAIRGLTISVNEFHIASVVGR